MQESDTVRAIIYALEGNSSPLISKVLSDEEIFESFGEEDNCIFYLTFQAQCLEFSHISRICIQRILKWFIRLASNIHYCRVWSEKISDQKSNTPLTTNFDMTTLTVSIQKLLICIGDELCILEAVVDGKVSLSNRSNVLGNDCSPITLLRLFTKLRPWEKLFNSIIKLIISFNNAYRASSNKEDYACHVGLLSEFDTFVKHCSMVEIIIDEPLIDKNASVPRDSTMKLSLHDRTFNLFGAFMKLLYPQFVEAFLSYIIKSNWDSASKSSSQVNSFSSPTKAFSSISSPSPRKWHHIKALGPSDLETSLHSKFSKRFSLRNLIQSIEKSYGDFEVIHKSIMTKKDYNKLRFLQQVVSGTENLFLSLRGNLSHDPNDLQITPLSSTFLGRYLYEGQLFDIIHSFYWKEKPQHCDSLTYISQLLKEANEEKREDLSLFEALISLRDQQEHSKGRSLKEGLWRHSVDLLDSKVVNALVEAVSLNSQSDEHETKDESNAALNPKHSLEVVSPSNRSTNHRNMFAPYTITMRQTVSEPLIESLRTVKLEALEVLKREFTLEKHLLFLRSVFLLGQLEIFDGVRELCMLFVVYNVDDEHELKVNRQVQYNSLQSILDSALDSYRPQKGLKFCSCYVPTMQELSRPEESTLFDIDSPSQKRSLANKAFDEQIFEQVLLRMRFEMHFQWPVSMVIAAPWVVRLQTVFRKLLVMMSCKWLSDSWWKAVIPRGGLFSKNDMKKFRLLPSEEQEKEKDIIRAKNTCQNGLIQVLHVINILNRFYLSKIHQELWTRFEDVYFKPATSIDHVISGVEALLELIEEMLSIIDEEFKVLSAKLFKSFGELRVAVTLEYQQSTRNTLLVAYRMAEISFEELIVANAQLKRKVLNWTNSIESAGFYSKDFLRFMEELQAIFTY